MCFVFVNSSIITLNAKIGKVWKAPKLFLFL